MKIAFICAFPSAANPGMYSVDLAIRSVVSAMPGKPDVTLFCAEQDVQVGAGKERLEYVRLRDQAQLSGYDRIVYWGDFLHWIRYANRDWLERWQAREPGKGRQEILDLWYRLLLLENAPALQKKAVVFGGTLYGLDSRQLLDARYRHALESLYRNARAVLMRDHLSANLVAQLAPRHVGAFGCDCTLLLDSRPLLEQGKARPQAGAADPYLLCSFARSGAKAALNAFVARLAAQMKLRAMRFDWLGERGSGGLAEKLSLVRNASIVVTDIYHLSVSAWRERVPALCVGRGSVYGDGTLSDKKKELFYGQIFAADRYLFLEDILEALRSDEHMRDHVRKCIEKIGDENANRAVFDMIDGQRERALARLVDALSRQRAHA